MTQSEVRWLGLCLSVVWLMFMPLFESNASHFSWGFFPSVIARVLVLLIALFSLTELFLRLKSSVSGAKLFAQGGLGLALLPLVPMLWAGFWCWRMFFTA